MSNIGPSPSSGAHPRSSFLAEKDAVTSQKKGALHRKNDVRRTLPKQRPLRKNYLEPSKAAYERKRFGTPYDPGRARKRSEEVIPPGGISPDEGTN